MGLNQKARIDFPAARALVLGTSCKRGGLMDQYIPPDARILDADADYKALAAQDPVWTPPPPPPRTLRANRREFIKGVIASGTAVSAVSYTLGARSAPAQDAAAPPPPIPLPPHPPTPPLPP